LYASWDRLGDISVALNSLKGVKKQMGDALKASYHSSTHTTPDTSSSIKKVAMKIQELNLHKFEPERRGDAGKLIVNTQISGMKKLTSSTLATFNKKVHGIIAGQWFVSGVQSRQQPKHHNNKVTGLVYTY
jgi:hypothetical protein